MSYRLYKPNSKNTGCAISFYLSFNSGNPDCVFLNMIKQASWDSKKRNGSFSKNVNNPNKTISIKLSINEVGGIINAISSKAEFSGYHRYNDNTTIIKFSTYKKKDGGSAFSLTVTRNSVDKFGLGIENGEAQCIRIYLEECLHRIFEHEIDELQKKSLPPDPNF